MLRTGAFLSAICTITETLRYTIIISAGAFRPALSVWLFPMDATVPGWFALVAYAVSGQPTAEVSYPFNILSDDEISAQDGILSMGFAAGVRRRLPDWLCGYSR